MAQLFDNHLVVNASGSCFVLQGTHCPSFGLIQTFLTQTSVRKDPNNGKFKVQFRDATGQYFDLTWTGVNDPPSPEEVNGQEALIALSLGRGLLIKRGPEHEGIAKKCYLLAIGLMLLSKLEQTE